jgi:hypothetical protein
LSEATDPSLSLRISSQGSDLENASTWMALGGWLSAACRGVYSCCGWFIPKLRRNADCNLAPKNLLERGSKRVKHAPENEIDWLVQGL